MAGRADSGGASAQPGQLSLRDLVTQLREVNKDIRSKRADKGIAATGMDRAAAAFQPMATLSATDGRNRQPNTSLGWQAVHRPFIRTAHPLIRH